MTLLPTVDTVADELSIIIYNAGISVEITRDNLKDYGHRTRLSEGFIQPFIRIMQKKMFIVDYNQNSGSITISWEHVDYRSISLNEAIKRSIEAQKTGCRELIDGSCIFDAVLDNNGNIIK